MWLFVWISWFELSPVFLIEAGPQGDAYSTLLPWLVALGISIWAWWVAFFRGWVSGASGTGFRLSLFAFYGSFLCEVAVSFLGADYPARVYDLLPRAAPWIWFLRNVGLSMFAFGLTMVAVACVRDVRMRRAGLGWAQSPI